MSIKGVIRQLNEFKTLKHRIEFINSLNIWTCYDLHLQYQKELEDWDYHHMLHIIYSIFFMGTRIDIRLYRPQWEYVNKLYHITINRIIESL